MAILNSQQILKSISVAKPILAREALAIVKENYFDPAVDKLHTDFNNDPVTKEIAGGIKSPNYSKTLSDLGHKDGKNLYSFIGFSDDESPLEPIIERLNPEHEDGPKIQYIRGSNKENLSFSFRISAPNKDAIYSATPLPWANGISWAERIELGLPGVTKFLNKFGLAKSRSGGGIQVKNDLRGARFYNRSYLTKIFNDFLARFKK